MSTPSTRIAVTRSLALPRSLRRISTLTRYSSPGTTLIWPVAEGALIAVVPSLYTMAVIFFEHDGIGQYSHRFAGSVV
jgi:hypothetical protein